MWVSLGNRFRVRVSAGDRFKVRVSMGDRFKVRVSVGIDLGLGCVGVILG